MSVTIDPLGDLAAMRRFGVACGLEDEGRDEEGILAAWGARDGGRLVGTIALERHDDLDTVNWLAVAEDVRRRGVATALLAAVVQEARDRGLRRLWVTARAPVFFISQGFEPVSAGAEVEALLSGCRACAQYGRGCEPQALTREIEGPSSESPRPRKEQRASEV